MGGLGEKVNSAAGGGRESEKNEDYLDKGELCPFSCSTHAPLNVIADIVFVFTQVSTSSRRSSWALEIRATRALSSKPRTSRSLISFEASTRAPLAVTSPPRTRRPDLVEQLPRGVEIPQRYVLQLLLGCVLGVNKRIAELLENGAVG